MAVIALRPVVDDDVNALFDMLRDPDSVAMAAFTPEDPDDRARFDTHLACVRTDPETTLRAITYDGRLAGTISAFVLDGDIHLTYWVDRALWGRGIAGEALTLFLKIFTRRPLHARVASDNARSLRVLRRAGFRPQATEISYAPARRTEIEETLLRLD